MRFRCCLILAAACAGSGACHAQLLQGNIAGPAGAGRQLVLLQANGADLVPYDSVAVAPNGDFQFKRHFDQTGFYQLALNDTDVVDLILDRREPLVGLQFSALPLANHLTVLASKENRRLQEMNYVVKESAAIQASVAQRKATLLPTDTAQLDALDRVRAKAVATQEQYLAELVDAADSSYFAKALKADRALQRTRGKGTRAVALAFGFGDPDLMRSSVYDKAIMAYFQNLRAPGDVQLSHAADTLMELAAGSPVCEAHMLDRLVDLFTTYGPEAALEHVIERYVVPAGGSAAVSPALRQKVERLLQVAVGKTAPDVRLNNHGALLQLSDLVHANNCTALFFYSSTCEHCHAQMPQMKKDLAEFGGKGFGVVGIALDVDSTDFLRSIQENQIPWPCFSEFNGWGSEAAKAFMVQATPTIFLLDRQMKIVAKPTDAKALSMVLEEQCHGRP